MKLLILLALALGLWQCQYSCDLKIGPKVAQAATPNLPLLRIEAAHRENCKIESRTYKRRDTAVSPRGAIGYCQVLPKTAAWIVKYAVEWGLLDRWAMAFYDKPKAWEWLLQIRWVNEAISRAYMAWIYLNRSTDLRVVLYLYHAGQDGEVMRGTESWRHSAEVYAGLYPWTVPPPAAREKQLTARN